MAGDLIPTDDDLIPASDDQALTALLIEAQEIGLVGPGPIRTHLDHARGFAGVVGHPPEGMSLDLGSGAGLPGLVLAVRWPPSRWLLVDGRARSADFLTAAVRRLGLEGRVTVIEGRAEVLAHDPDYRGTVEVVVARSVAAPPVVAECAAGFLAPGGRLVVSEPPDHDGQRWDTAGLARLGMGPSRAVESGGMHFSVVTQRVPCPSEYPRRTGVPARRPLF